MWTLVSISLAYLGFAALAAAMPRHLSLFTSGAKLAPRARGRRRAAGCVGLAISAVPPVMVYGGATGMTAWLGVLMIAAFLLAMAFTLRELCHARRILWIPVVVVAIGALGAGLWR